MSRFLLLNFEDFGLNQDITKTIQSRTLFCICCLERNVSFINLLTCSHADYLNNFTKPELKPINEVICYPCHDILKKIKLFKLQVEQSFNLLTTQAIDSETTDTKKRNFELCNVVNIYLPPETPVAEPETTSTEPPDKPVPTTALLSIDKNKMKNIEKALQIINNNSKSDTVKLLTDSVKDLVEKEAAPIMDMVTCFIKKEATEPVIVKIEGNASAEEETAGEQPLSPNRLNIKNITLTEEELKTERANISSSQAYMSLPYRCDKCLVGFNYKENLEDHNNRKHFAKKGSVICDICEQILYPAGSYTAHRFRHFSRFECGICNKRFHWYESAYDHYNRTHYKDTRPSKEERRRANASKLADPLGPEVKNQKKFEAKNRIACKICRRTFKNNENLKRHMTHRHLEPVGLECDLCGRKYSSRIFLKKHMAEHFFADKRKKAKSTEKQ